MTSPCLNQCQVMLLQTGNEIAYSTFEMIDSASFEIILTEFIFRDDEFGQITMALLSRKAREGVRVVLLVDAFRFVVSASYIHFLKLAGVQVFVFNRPFPRFLFHLSYRNHAKVLVIDRSRFKTGDSNIGNEYVNWPSDEQMLSLDIYCEGSSGSEAYTFAELLLKSRYVQEVRTEVLKPFSPYILYFLSRWHSRFINKFLRPLKIDFPSWVLIPWPVRIEKDDLDLSERSLDQAGRRFQDLKRSSGWMDFIELKSHLLNVEQCKFLGDQIDLKGTCPGIEVEILNEVRAAKRSIQIVTPYLLLTKSDQTEIQNALERGVKVEIYTNSFESNDHYGAQLAFEMRKKEYAKIGDLRIYEFEGPKTLHAKFIVRDCESAIVMAYNLDFRSRFLNVECGLRVQNSYIANQLSSWVTGRLSRFVLVTANRRALKHSYLSATKGLLDKLLIFGRMILVKIFEKQF